MSCTDIIDGDLSASLLLTDGVDLTESVESNVDTSVPGSTDYVVACTDSDDNTTTVDFRVHVSFSEVVDSLQEFARSRSAFQLRDVIENSSMTLTPCADDASNSSLVSSTWGVGWHPRALVETFLFCAVSTSDPTAEFLADFVVELAVEHGLNLVRPHWCWGGSRVLAPTSLVLRTCRHWLQIL